MAQRTEKQITGINCERLLALEIRSSKMGFVVFACPATPLDWGLAWYGAKSGALSQAVSTRIRSLLGLHNPSRVVARNRKYSSAAANRRFATIASSIRAESLRHSAIFTLISAQHVKRHFASRGLVTKHEIATSLGRTFEELYWKLPRRRKAYESEHPSMLIFDAAATGTAFLEEVTRQQDAGPVGPS
jgi:hypothetical protein